MKRLPRDFFERSTVEVARDLLGKRLSVHSETGLAEGFIVETEAYLGLEDPASHAYRGKTARNEVMFEACGYLYVYLSYGVHQCVNTVAKPPGAAAGAVLLRAVQPCAGVGLMAQRRGLQGDPPETLEGRWRGLTNGPGKLTQALGIGPQHNGLDLSKGPVRIGEGFSVAPSVIGCSPRIGISQAVDLPYRFFLRDNPFVSRR